MARRKAPHIADELLDQLLSGTDAAAALQQGGLLDELKKALAERALNAEMDHHLAGEGGTGNSRNGYGRKTVLTDTGGRIALEVPRDRQGSFEPTIVRKRQRRLSGVEDLVLSLSAKGLTTGEISAHLAEVYGAEVSKQTISTITDKVMEGMAELPADCRRVPEAGRDGVRDVGAYHPAPASPRPGTPPRRPHLDPVPPRASCRNAGV